MGDILRDFTKQDTLLAKRVKGAMEKGQLVPDKIVIEVLKDHISQLPKGQGFILDGFPRTVQQAEELARIIEIDVIIQLIVPDSIIIDRLSTRRICKNCGAVYNVRYLKPKLEGVCNKCGGHLYQRADDNPTVIKQRLEVYEKQTSPLVKYYKDKNTLFIVHETTESKTPPDVVAEEIVAALKKSKLA
jgi:adenylate kinase